MSERIPQNETLANKLHVLENKIRLIKLWNRESIASNTKKWKEKLNKKVMAFQIKEMRYKQQILQLRENLQREKETYETILNRVFTPSQKSMLMDEKSKTRYKDVDISRALTLKFISQRAYDLVRDIWLIPLPCQRTQRK